MIHEHYTVTEHGFVGHLAEPDAGSDRAVIVVMGGEKNMAVGELLLCAQAEKVDTAVKTGGEMSDESIFF